MNHQRPCREDARDPAPWSNGAQAIGVPPFADVLADTHRVMRRAGSTLKLEGEVAGGHYVLFAGWLAVAKSMLDGHRQIVDVVLPGGFLDAVSADLCTSAVEIEALTDVSYAAIPRQDWQRLLRECPDLARASDGSARAAMSRMSARMLRLGKGSADSIVAFALCELCLRSTGGGLSEGWAYHIPMTQQQLGDFCGLSAVHMCRTLQRFRRDDILELRAPMRMVIRDLPALAAIAEIDPPVLRQQIVPAA